MFNIGDVVRKARRSRDWSVEQLAEAAGIRPNTVSKFENRPAKSWTSTLELIARALDTTPAKLYENATELAQPKPKPAKPDGLPARGAPTEPKRRAG